MLRTRAAPSGLIRIYIPVIFLYYPVYHIFFASARVGVP